VTVMTAPASSWPDNARQRLPIAPLADRKRAVARISTAAP